MLGLNQYNISELPKITYYARVRSNLTGQILTAWQMYDKNTWYYGKCNSLQGGESEYIIEFDIWNNEPGFNAGEYDIHNLNAIFCNLSIEPLNTTADAIELFKLGFPFLYARCASDNTRENWEQVTIDSPLKKLYGTVYKATEGTLYGDADHMIIQTKIIMPANTLLTDRKRYPFNLVFSYSYE